MDRDNQQKSEKKIKSANSRRGYCYLQQGNLSYVEILKKVKVDPDLNDISGNVNRVQRTQKGGFLVRAEKSQRRQSDGFRTQVPREECYNACPKIWDLHLHLDELISKEKNLRCFIIEEQFKLDEFAEESIVTLRKAYGITIRLPVEAAEKLLEVDKVPIE